MEEETESCGTEASGGLDDRRNNRVRCRRVRGGEPSKMPAFGLLFVLECTIVAGYTFVIRGEERHLQAWDTVGGRSTLQHTIEFL